MKKYAEIIDGKVVTISFAADTEWPEVPDTTFPGDIDNGDGTFSRPAPPVLTDEERRAAMSPLTARQFRIALVQSGRTRAQVDQAISAIPDPMEREIAEIEWQTAAEFKRLHPLVVNLAPVLNFTPEEIDTLWEAALEI